MASAEPAEERLYYQRAHAMAIKIRYKAEQMRAVEGIEKCQFA
jgi:hypothetical protein